MDEQTLRCDTEHVLRHGDGLTYFDRPMPLRVSELKGYSGHGTMVELEAPAGDTACFLVLVVGEITGPAALPGATYDEEEWSDIS